MAAIPILEALKEWLDREYDQVLPASVIGKAIAYTLKRWHRGSSECLSPLCFHPIFYRKFTEPLGFLQDVVHRTLRFKQFRRLSVVHIIIDGAYAK